MSEPPVETISITPKREGKPPTQLSILSQRKIGGGTYGNVFQTEMMMGNHRANFVVKRFKSTDALGNGDVTTAKENAAKAMANYEAAKKAGLKVFTTYRLGEDQESILMTSGNTKSTFCIGTALTSYLPNIGESKIQSIESTAYGALVDGVFNQALQATKHDISIHSDAIFFLFDKTTGGVDFVIGDLDNVYNRPLPPDQSRLLGNLRSARISLHAFISGNVENPDSYLEPINRAYNEIKVAQGYGNY